MKQKVLPILALTLTWCAIGSGSQAENYERRGDDWFVRDATDYEWRVCPGRLIVHFAPDAALESIESVVSRQHIHLLDPRGDSHL